MYFDLKDNAVLILADGTTIFGKSAGAKGTAVGEICFNTGMTGYQEIFTDPSYYGQIMVTTNAHIGNYGYSDKEVESESVKISGLVCKDFNFHNSRHASLGDLKDYFEKEKIVCIYDLDTRALVRHIRDKGAMNAIISSEITDVKSLKDKLQKVPSMEGLELSSFVSTKKSYTVGDEQSDYRVSVLDLGVKKNILRCLEKRGVYIKVFPINSSLEDLLSFNPTGIFLSNGPGDPSVMLNTIELVKKIINKNIPTFGICLGHQIIALAGGLKTFKMHTGHRGINHPILNLETNKGEITSQNHGFSIDESSLLENTNIKVTHRNLNDNSIEGIKFLNKQCFSVQYHPESSPGPHDSRYLFDYFVENMDLYINKLHVKN
ncbi:MAG: carbamoyl phosphate synthase small subunit [Flavobacteriales bacterium]|nr:carbamoyl phosphate synthase small subunit [Flavobacteriales bacterium]